MTQGMVEENFADSCVAINSASKLARLTIKMLRRYFVMALK